MTTPPQPRLLHRAGGLHVFHRPGTTPWTLVTFAPRLAQVGPERWWGSTFTRHEGLDIIGVVSTDFDWYPRAAMAAVLPVVQQAAQPDRVVCGFGMGGYAALKYASALEAKAAIGLSPQFSIDPADGTAEPWESAWFDPERHGGMRIAPGDFPRASLLMWDPHVAGDDRHARAIAALRGIRPIPLRLAGPGTEAVFTETRQLQAVGEFLLAGRVGRVMAAMRAVRRRMPQVLLTAATLLDAHGHPAWAEAADRLARQRPVAPARLQEARARAFARLGRLEEELDALRAWIAAAPRDAEARLRLAWRLQALDRAEEAEAVAREGHAAGIRDPRLDALLPVAASPVDAPAVDAPSEDAPAVDGPAEALPPVVAAPVVRVPPPEPPPEGHEGRPPPYVVAESDSLRLWYWPGEGPGTLIIFTPATATPPGPMEWWARGQAAWLGWPTLVFAAHKPCWYPADEMEGLLPEARAALPPGPRVTYGSGMGAYGAMKYGRRLGAEASVALSPVFSLNPAEVPNDPRSSRQFDPDRMGDMRMRLRDLAPLPVIAFDPLVRPDAIQARRLAALPPVRAVPLRHGGAGLTALLVETGRFEPLLRAALQGDAEGARTALREARRRSRRLREIVAAAAETRGHARFAAGLRILPPAEQAPPTGPVADDPIRRLSLQARMLRREQKPAEEEAVLRQWIAADPAAGEPRLMLSHCLLRVDRSEEGIAVLREALRDGAGDALLHAALVRQLRRAGGRQRTLVAARAAAAAYPQDAALLGLLGETCLWAEQPEEAAAAFRAALEIDAEHGEALLGLAVLEEDAQPGGPPGPCLAARLRQLASRATPEAEWLRTIDRLWNGGRNQAAMLTAEAALEQIPDAIGPMQRIARILAQDGRSEEALHRFAALARSAPDDPAGWLGAIELLLQLKRNEDGRRIAAQAIARHPQDAVLATRHAAAILALGDGAAAETEARRAIALGAEGDAVHLLVIDALRRQERRRDALAATRAALEAVPGSQAIASRLGGMLMEQGKPGEAAEVYQRMVAQSSKPGRSQWLSLAKALDAADRSDEAEAVVRQGLAGEPGATELQNYLGEMLLRRGESGAAREALASAIAADPDSTAVSLAMARALLTHGSRTEARALLESVVTEAPGHVSARLELGQLLLDDGKPEEAGAIFFAMTQSDADNAVAWMGLADAYRLCKQVKPALAAYQQAIAAGLDAHRLRNLRYRLFGEYDG